jgi:hypothetical protein
MIVGYRISSPWCHTRLYETRYRIRLLLLPYIISVYCGHDFIGVHHQILDAAYFVDCKRASPHTNCVIECPYFINKRTQQLEPILFCWRRRHRPRITSPYILLMNRLGWLLPYGRYGMCGGKSSTRGSIRVL